MNNQIKYNTSAALIATLGSEPQVITTTLDLLSRAGESIRKTVVVHTAPQDHIISAALHALREEFSRSPYNSMYDLQLIPIQDKLGSPVPDVEKPLETEAAFSTIYNEIRSAKMNQMKVHLLIAGGRKTLSLFGMAAAQILFDQDDLLWHLSSGDEYRNSKRMHPQPGDETHLIPIPVIRWSQVSPILTDLNQFIDPFQAVDYLQKLQIDQKIEKIRVFIADTLTPGEERVVSLLATQGLSDNQIAERLILSPRTVEGHLRSAYAKAAAHWEIIEVNRSTLIALLSLYYSTQQQ